MTNITFTGKHWIGAGLVYRKSGTYAVSDELAHHLTKHHPDLFALSDQTMSSDTETPAAETNVVEPTAGQDTTPEDTTSDETSVEAVKEDVKETGDADLGKQDEVHSQPSDAPEETDEPEATQNASEDSAQTKPLSKMNRTELVAVAARIDLEVTNELTNKDLAEAIRARQEEAAA